MLEHTSCSWDVIRKLVPTCSLLAISNSQQVSAPVSLARKISFGVQDSPESSIPLN